ncbi:prophage tail fiber family protein [Escherichia coli 99.1775]|nr:prophage tail fiber family protein [Escherichia coli 99.1775]
MLRVEFSAEFTQVVILDADKKQIQCVVRPLQILRADGTWENIGGMK